MPNPRGVRPGSRGARPGSPGVRPSAFNRTPAAKAFKQFETSFEAAEEEVEEFLGASHQLIEVVDQKGNQARVHITGMSPLQQDPFGILKSLQSTVMAEIKNIALDELEKEHTAKERRQHGIAATRPSVIPGFSKK